MKLTTSHQVFSKDHKLHLWTLPGKRKWMAELRIKGLDEAQQRAISASGKFIMEPMAPVFYDGRFNTLAEAVNTLNQIIAPVTPPELLFKPQFVRTTHYVSQDFPVEFLPRLTGGWEVRPRIIYNRDLYEKISNTFYNQTFPKLKEAVEAFEEAWRYHGGTEYQA